jgi:heme/copper-type cytochrome/quinol oxidase subunit 3
MKKLTYGTSKLTNSPFDCNTLWFQEQFKYLKTTHSYHLVDPSPWPAVASLGAFMITSGGVLYMHKFVGGWNLFLSGFLLTFYVMYTWWRDVVREATFEEQHSVAVQKGLRLGMILFIASEIMFFFAFFWAFFHSSIAPVYNIGGVWPPKAITPMDTYTIPLTNTFFLLTSGATVTWAHHAIVARAKKQTLLALFFTLVLATLFTGLQGLEYVEASFNISDGIYGSCFYLATGFHGFHVFVGTIALLVSFVRIVFNHFTNQHHFGFESAIWYWHFVDVVWLFLFLNVYWWGNSSSDHLVVATPLAASSGSSLNFSVVEMENLSLRLLLYTKGLFFGKFFIVFVTNIFFGLYLIYKVRKDSNFASNKLERFAGLSLKTQIVLGLFTITLAVPNKVLINQPIKAIYLYFLSVFYLFLGFIEPLLWIFFVQYFFLAIFSWAFAHFYCTYERFREQVNLVFFENDISLSKEYFNFFWGEI